MSVAEAQAPQVPVEAVLPIAAPAPSPELQAVFETRCQLYIVMLLQLQRKRQELIAPRNALVMRIKADHKIGEAVDITIENESGFIFETGDATKAQLAMVTPDEKAELCRIPPDKAFDRMERNAMGELYNFRVVGP